MPLTKEKRFSIAGVQIRLTTDLRRAERIRRNPLYRYVLKPGLGLLNRKQAAPPPVQEGLRPLAMPPRPPDGAAGKLWDRVSRLNWYHTIDLGNGVVTPGFIDNRDQVERFGLPKDLTGKRCLDIGTYDGFWAFEMERRGADEVIGIDVDSPADYDIPRKQRARLVEGTADSEELRERFDTQMEPLGLQMPGDGFRLAKEVLGSRARREGLNVYDLSPEKLGVFDVVLISQLLIRLRDPQTVIENMFSVCRGMAIIAEPYDEELEALPRPVSEYIGTERVGSWWSHSIKSMQKMMEIAGFEPVEVVARYEVTNRVGSFPKVILRGYVPGGCYNPAESNRGSHADQG